MLTKACSHGYDDLPMILLLLLKQYYYNTTCMHACITIDGYGIQGQNNIILAITRSARSGPPD